MRTSQTPVDGRSPGVLEGGRVERCLEARLAHRRQIISIQMGRRRARGREAGAPFEGRGGGGGRRVRLIVSKHVPLRILLQHDGRRSRRRSCSDRGDGQRRSRTEGAGGEGEGGEDGVLGEMLLELLLLLLLEVVGDDLFGHVVCK